jgi:hypothetical protein
MTIGSKQFVIKPALIVLAGAVVLGAFGPLYAKRLSVQPQLAWKCLNLDTWKLEVRRSAIAELTTSPSAHQVLSKSEKNAAYNIDLSKGIAVDIKQHDGAADCVDLRNAVNFEEIKSLNGLAIRFTAHAESPHELVLILRERDQVRWSAKVQVAREPKEISLPISFKSCESNQAILSIHLGGETGKTGLKNLRIEQQKP